MRPVPRRGAIGRERDSVFIKGIALGRLTIAKQKVTYLGVYGQHKVDLIV